MAQIQDLPVELLTAIFLYLRCLPSTYEREPTCKGISQVCEHWREVALNTPELWTLIPLVSARWTKLCIARSSPAPIVVHAEWLRDYEHEARRKTLQLVYPEVHRISSLRISSMAYLINHRVTADGIQGELHTTQILADLFTDSNAGAAVTLSDLFISFDDGAGQISEDPHRHTFGAGTSSVETLKHPADLPLAMFGASRLDALKAASFKACRLPLSWSGTFLPTTLRSLTLVDASAWRNVDTLVAFFRLVPNLESLDVQRPGKWRTCPFSAIPSLAHPPRCAQLARLHTLRVYASFGHILALLTYLSLPVITCIDISVRGKARLIPDAEPLLQLGTTAIRDHFAPAAADGLAHGHVGVENGRITAPCSRTLTRTLQVSHVDVGTSRSSVNIHLGNFEKRDNTPYHRDAYALFLLQPMFSGAESMTCLDFLPPGVWPLFHHFTTRSLCLGPASYDCFMEAIADAPSEAPLFPSLRRLIIANGSLDRYDVTRRTRMRTHEIMYIQRLRDIGQRIIQMAQRLAQYDEFESLVLAGSAVQSVAEETLSAITNILGEERVELQAESPSAS
ncbi:unnamed protein product [Peniophora sp. CBMAI 1063]|nr:unnamed protein product [Peniophora sp. CBMAI 1063]